MKSSSALEKFDCIDIGVAFQENLGNPAEIPQHILAHIRQELASSFGSHDAPVTNHSTEIVMLASL
eukprot:5701524-Amphidinium_carterae.1